MPNCLTPSINVYYAQQERFEYFRRRFLTQTVTVYPCPYAAISYLNETGAIEPNGVVTTTPTANLVEL